MPYPWIEVPTIMDLLYAMVEHARDTKDQGDPHLDFRLFSAVGERTLSTLLFGVKCMCGVEWSPPKRYRCTPEEREIFRRLHRADRQRWQLAGIAQQILYEHHASLPSLWDKLLKDDDEDLIAAVARLVRP